MTTTAPRRQDVFFLGEKVCMKRTLLQGCGTGIRDYCLGFAVAKTSLVHWIIRTAGCWHQGYMRRRVAAKLSQVPDTAESMPDSQIRSEVRVVYTSCGHLN